MCVCVSAAAHALISHSVDGLPSVWSKRPEANDAAQASIGPKDLPSVTLFLLICHLFFFLTRVVLDSPNTHSLSPSRITLFRSSRRNALYPISLQVPGYSPPPPPPRAPPPPNTFCLVPRRWPQFLNATVFANSFPQSIVHVWYFSLRHKYWFSLSFLFNCHTTWLTVIPDRSTAFCHLIGTESRSSVPSPGHDDGDEKKGMQCTRPVLDPLVKVPLLRR